MLESILIIIASFTNIVLGATVLTRYKSLKKEYVYFSLATISVGLWSASTIALNVNTIMFWEDVLFISSTSALFFITLYSFGFLQRPKEVLVRAYSLFFLLIITLLVITDTIIASVSKDYQASGVDVELGKLFILFIIFVITSIGLVISNLVDAYKKVDGVKKQQIRYLLLGIIGFAIPTIITNMLLPLLGIYSFNNTGVIFSLFFTFTVFTSIIKHRLFSVRSIAIKTLKYFIVGLILFLIVFSLRLFKDKLLNLEIYDANSLFIDFIAAIFIGIFITSLIISLDNKLTKFINPEVYLLNQMIKKMDKDINKELDPIIVINKTLQLLMSGYPNNGIYFVTYKKGKFHILPENKISKIVSINKIKPIKRTIIIQEGADTEYDFIRDNSALEIVSNINETNWLIFTKDYHSDAFTKDELDTIENIIFKLKEIFNRVKIYETTKEFNRILEEKVEKATSELKEKNIKLAEKIEFERDMLDILGHELRTPLSIVRNAVFMNRYLLKTPNPEINKIMKYNEMAVEHVTREIGLLETMLSATKIDNDRLQINFEKVDLIDVVNDSLEGLKSKAIEKGLKMEFIKPKKCFVIADRTRIQEVADNLIDNAIKYTDSGKVEIEIIVERSISRLLIKDTGRGIPKDEIEKLGQKFYRVDNYLKGSANNEDRIVRPGGTGLGLYVTFTLVKAMKGRIEIESTLGKGSIFTIVLRNP